MCGAWAQQVSRQPPPPLPGGYTVGEQVYFTGTSETFEDGDQVEHGKQGEVVGPATTKSHNGKGVTVRFPGNKGAIRCHLDHVRHRTATATRSHPQLPPPPQLPLLPAHAPTHDVWRVGATGKPPAATASAGRLHGGRARLLHGDE